MAVIHGESHFEKNAFEDTENPTRPLQLDFQLKNISGNISDFEKNLFYFEALLTAYFIPWKAQF